MSLTIVTAYHVLVEKFQPLLIHPDVSVLPGLHLQVVLAVHGVVDHQLSCLNVVRHVENIKKLPCQPQSSQHHILLKKTSTDVIYPTSVSVLLGLLLNVVLALHTVVDHQTI